MDSIFYKFQIPQNLYLMGSMSHKLYIQTLCFTNSSSYRVYLRTSQISSFIGSIFSFSLDAASSHSILFYLSAKNEISESFIFLTNCFLSRFEKSLDRFSIPRELANFLSAREFSVCIVFAAEWERRRERPKGVNTFPFGAVGEGRWGRQIYKKELRSKSHANQCRPTGMWGGEAKRRGCCRSFFVDTRRYAAQREERGRERESEREGQRPRS